MPSPIQYQLFGAAARCYDLHTPPHHYQDDHAFVLAELRSPGRQPVLDVGCGTGVFLQRARAASLEAFGIDASPEMVDVAARRLGPGIVRVTHMQDLEEREAYGALVSLCWSFNYCQSTAEARDILRRFHQALRPGGLLLLQVAHAPAATGSLQEDWEVGPEGKERDVQFLYQFLPEIEDEPRLRARYTYACRSLGELFWEEHVLHVADARLVAGLVLEAGFRELQVFASWRREPLVGSISPFVLAVKPGL
jgi:SAM-dependent methyltransferase